MSEQIILEAKEYKRLVDRMERMRETIDVLSDEQMVKKLKSALARVNAGEFLTKTQVD